MATSPVAKSDRPGFFKTKVEVEAMDIRTMSELALADYRAYLDELLWIDHHDVLRSQVAGYPVAATEAQLEELIQHLQKQRGRLKDL